MAATLGGLTLLLINWILPGQRESDAGQSAMPFVSSSVRDTV